MTNDEFKFPFPALSAESFDPQDTKKAMPIAKQSILIERVHHCIQLLEIYEHLSTALPGIFLKYAFSHRPHHVF